MISITTGGKASAKTTKTQPGSNPEPKSMVQRALDVPRTAITPLTKVEQRVVAELSSAANRARKRVGL